MSAHTPGPWSFASGNDEDGNPAKITTVAWCSDYVIGLPSDIPGGNYRDGDPSGDPEADARLIAAAPDLLMELRLLLEAVRAHCDTEHPYIECRLAFSDDAIAKATGAQA